MSYQMREDIPVVLGYVFGAATSIGILIGKALKGGFYTLGVCVVLKLFGVI